MEENYKTCKKCLHLLKIDNFYKNNDGSRNDLCKSCLTMHINNFEPDTFTWILKEMNYPYVPTEWNKIRDAEFNKNPNNIGGTSAFGKYMSKMKLKQYKGKTWEDSKLIQQEYEQKVAATANEREKYEESLKQQLEAGEITEAQYKTLVSTETQNQEQKYIMSTVTSNVNNPYDNPNDYIDDSLLIDLAADLTDDDKVYLAMKWGKYYKPSEWVELEKSYNEMMNSFDIQDADTIHTLILICKTNLKMNQAIDSADIESYQKLAKVSESLRKTAKFTAAQNKEDKDEYVDSVGELILMCERDGFIPRFVTDVPQDKVDATLKDMNDYVKKLVTQDLGFGQQIEDAIKKIQIQKEMEESFDQEVELEDNDFEDYYAEIEEQRHSDEEALGVED